MQLPPETRMHGGADAAKTLHAILGSQNPHPQTFLVGGMAIPINPDSQHALNADKLMEIKRLLAKAKDFVEKVYIPDLLAVACIEEAQRLLIIDAVETGAPPGTLVRLSGEEIPLTLETKLSPHQMGLKDLLTVASLLDFAPTEMVLRGVQPESVEMTLQLSAPVQAQLETLAGKVLEELAAWGVFPEEVAGEELRQSKSKYRQGGIVQVKQRA